MRGSVQTSSLALVVLVLGVATSSCGFLPKKVTKESCEKWGDQFSTITKAQAEKETKKCLGKDDKDKLKEANKRVAKEIDKLREKIVEGCTEQEGKNYLAKDADCFMKASEMKDWKSCDFTTPFFQDFDKVADGFSKGFQEKCKGGGGGGGDDDDKPKKGKKAKDED